MAGNGLPPLPVGASPTGAPLAAGAASPTGVVVMTPVHTPASLGLSNFIERSPQNSRGVAIASPSPVARQTISQAASPAGCGNVPALSTFQQHLTPVVQTIQQTCHRVSQVPCVSNSLQTVQGSSARVWQTVSTAAVGGMTAVDRAGQKVEPFVGTALTKYCLPTYAAVREAHTEYVVPTATRVRQGYNQHCHEQYTVPTVNRAGAILGQARNTYMDNYHQHVVVQPLNRAQTVVGQWTESCLGKPSQQPTTPIGAAPQQPTTPVGQQPA
eukprot:TRINITY_DN56468_c0_g1_i1.p1 TRINITY_DN56468_c0_g1~~TRINITY_DN56468_c0_g1_i1.p1  ORF type:complete len:290 (-),score=26.45 TRINITY_DN56468_c0_g1_i1:202-1011(-)